MTLYGVEWDFGQRIELAVRNWFLNDGWFVVPTHLIENGGAPKLLGQLRSFVLPDFQMARGGLCRWVEVKAKQSFVKYQKVNALRTGIHERHWLDYRAVEHESGLPGYMAMVHVHRVPDGPIDPLLLLAPFAHLMPPDQTQTENLEAFGGRPMVWWHIDRFDWYDLPAQDLSDLPSLTPRTLHPWERKLKPPKRGRYQPPLF